MNTHHPDVDYRDSHQSSKHADKYEKLVTEGSYNSILWMWEQEVINERLLQLKITDTDKCLDFACGTGRIVRLLGNHYANVTGLDISNSMISKAREKYPKTRFVLGDATRDPIMPDETFDLITSFRFFLNAQDGLRKEVLAYLNQKLSKDGMLIFNIHLQHNSIQHIFLRAWWVLCGKPKQPTLSISHMRQLLYEVGIDIVDLEHFGVLPVSNKLLPLPKFAFNMIERWFSNIPMTRCMARNVVCICKRRSLSEST